MSEKIVYGVPQATFQAVGPTNVKGTGSAATNAIVAQAQATAAAAASAGHPQVATPKK